MGEAKRRRELGTMPERKRFEPGVVVLEDTLGRRRPFWIDAGGRVHVMTQGRRVSDPALILAAQRAAKRIEP